MRTLVKPPPSTRCELCGGELRLKLVEPANRTLDLENEIFVCTDCGRELSCIVDHDRYAGHTTTNVPHTAPQKDCGVPPQTRLVQYDDMIEALAAD
jgi:hypothetical protein